MIQKLIIKNYLIIKEAEINFKYGFNVLTGETGAGKTIILDAISLLLGERADYSIIKKDKEKLVIEGFFEFKEFNKINNFLKRKDIESDIKNGINDIILRRELSKKGNSRCFINDTPVLISDMKEFGDLIVDIHSQNEHQSLLRKDTHTEVLDSFLIDNKVLNEFKKIYFYYKEKFENFNKRLKNKENLEDRKSFIEFQLREINNLNPSESEDELIENELKKLENTEEIDLSVNNVLDLLSEKENNVINNIFLSIKELKKASRYDEELVQILNDIENSAAVLKESSENLAAYKNGLDFDFTKTENLRARLGEINFLKKKYKLSVNELIKKELDLKGELELAENFDFEIEKAEKELFSIKEEVFETAQKLSKERIRSGRELEKNVDKYLKEVGLENAVFKVEIGKNSVDENERFFNNKKFKVNSTGIDDIEFLISTNKGDSLHQLRKIASGGEVSRIMLSIKASLSGKDSIPIMVFDEIDTGISGRIADKVGKVIKEISKKHQIISITHLPQIAALSDNHLSVSKEVNENETVAYIKKLSEEDKIIEIAKLLSGEKITEATLKSAKELINGK